MRGAASVPRAGAAARRARALGGWFAMRPATSAILAVLLAGSLVGGVWSPLHESVRRLLGTGYEPVVELGRWWTVGTSLVFTDRPLEVVPVLVLAAAVLGTAERSIGAARMLAAHVGTSVVGTLAGVGLQALGLRMGELWAHGVVEYATLDPLTGVAGTATFLSSRVPALWRRRLRVITLAGCAVLLLYAGRPADLYRLLAAITGLVAGLATRPSEIAAPFARSSHHEVRVLLATVVGIVAVGPVASLATGARFGLLAPLTVLLTQPMRDEGRPLCTVADVTAHCAREITLERIAGPGPVVVSIVPLVVLLVAAAGILRGRRVGVWIAVVVEGLLGLLAAVYYGILPAVGDPATLRRPADGRHPETVVSLVLAVVVPVAVAAACLVLRRHVAVRTSRRSLVRIGGIVALVALALAAAGVTVALVDPDGFGPHATPLAVLIDLPERAVPVDFLRREIVAVEPVTVAARTVWEGLGPAFWLAVAIGALLAVRAPAADADRGDTVRVRTLLEAGGGESIGWMATWPGSRHWFDPAGRAGIAYRVIGGVALTLGAPVGPDHDDPAVLARFARFADDAGLTPVLYGLDGRRRDPLVSAGWSVVTVAEETIVHPQAWSTTGKRWQDVRSSVNRAARAGIRAEWTTWASLDLAGQNQLVEMSEQWVADKALPEMGFTLGGVDELRDARVPIMIAAGPEGRIEAVTSWLPWYTGEGLTGYTLDFMRRRPDSPNGVMEFLIAAAAERMRDDGLERMSLSAAPLARSRSDGDASALDALLDALGSSLEPVYGFRSLFAFKRKFQPELVPVVMAFADPVALPAIGLALARAYLPTLSVAQVGRFLRERGGDPRRGRDSGTGGTSGTGGAGQPSAAESASTTSAREASDPTLPAKTT